MHRNTSDYSAELNEVIVIAAADDHSNNDDGYDGALFFSREQRNTPSKYEDRGDRMATEATADRLTRRRPTPHESSFDAGADDYEARAVRTTTTTAVLSNSAAQITSQPTADVYDTAFDFTRAEFPLDKPEKSTENEGATCAKSDDRRRYVVTTKLAEFSPAAGEGSSVVVADGAGSTAAPPRCYSTDAQQLCSGSAAVVAGPGLLLSSGLQPSRRYCHYRSRQLLPDERHEYRRRDDCTAAMSSVVVASVGDCRTRQYITPSEHSLVSSESRQPESLTVNNPPSTSSAGSIKRCQCGRTHRPTFGFPGQRRKYALWCSQCPNKPPNAIELVNSKFCACGLTVPSFGIPADEEPHPGGMQHLSSSRLIRRQWCSKCPDIPSNAVDLKHSKRCVCGCHQPSFGLPGSQPKDAHWCSKCPSKPPEAVDVVHRRRCSCGRSGPSFGLSGWKRRDAKWCSKCPDKPTDAVDLLNIRKCECGGREPSFGLPGGLRKDARWCLTCPNKPGNAVDVKNIKRCECGSHQPSFGLPGGKRRDARWCSKCPSRPPDAIDLINCSKRCECGKSEPSFGRAGGRRKDAQWCFKCPGKPLDAVNLVRVARKNSLQQPP